ncbi:MAG: hypothetical protein V9E87_14405 [Gemmatimonadales bacterium]
MSPFGLEIEPLSPDHAADPAGLEELHGERTSRPRVERQRLRRLGQRLGRNGDEQETDPRRGGDIEGTMRRRPPPAHGVIVHAGEVVVDQRVGVDDLHRRRHFEHGVGIAPDRARRAQQERRARRRFPGLRSA